MFVLYQLCLEILPFETIEHSARPLPDVKGTISLDQVFESGNMANIAADAD